MKIPLDADSGPPSTLFARSFSSDSAKNEAAGISSIQQAMASGATQSWKARTREEHCSFTASKSTSVGLGVIEVYTELRVQVFLDWFSLPDVAFTP